jgi:response regulator RpfG family c-di-GMP phosphodiesterase
MHFIGLAAGMTEKEADDLLHAAPMHDVGKIGIPDRILQKPGRLEPEEWKIMQSHATIGAEIIGEHPSGMLALARNIALTHHEKWDASEEEALGFLVEQKGVHFDPALVNPSSSPRRPDSAPGTIPPSSA